MKRAAWPSPVRAGAQTGAPPSPSAVMIPLGIGTALSLLGDNTLYTVLPRPEFSAEAGVSIAMVGLLLGANRAVRLIFNGAAGALFDRLPRRPLMIVSLFIGALSTALYALSRGFPLMLLGRVLWGLAWSGIWIGGSAMVLDISGPANRGRFSGQYQTWFCLGVAIAGLAGGLFTDIFSFRGGLWISSAVTLMGVVIWWFFLPETRTLSHDVDSAPPSSAPMERFPWVAVFSAAIPVFVVRFALAGVMSSTTILWLGSIVGDRVQLGAIVVPIASATGLFVALRSVASMGGAPLTGLASDRSRRRWGMLAIVASIGAGASWLMGSETLFPAFTGGLIVSAAGSAIQALAPAIIGDQVEPGHRGRSLGLAYTIGDLGSAIGPPLALWLVASVSVGTLYRGCALLLVTLALYAAAIGRHRDRVVLGSSGARSDGP